MFSESKTVQFIGLGHSALIYDIILSEKHLLTTGTDDPSFAGPRAIIKMLGHQHRWLADGYDLEIGHLLKWFALWLPGGWCFFVQCSSINKCSNLTLTVLVTTIDALQHFGTG